MYQYVSVCIILVVMKMQMEAQLWSTCIFLGWHWISLGFYLLLAPHFGVAYLLKTRVILGSQMYVSIAVKAHIYSQSSICCDAFKLDVRTGRRNLSSRLIVQRSVRCKHVVVEIRTRTDIRARSSAGESSAVPCPWMQVTRRKIVSVASSAVALLHGVSPCEVPGAWSGTLVRILLSKYYGDMGSAEVELTKHTHRSEVKLLGDPAPGLTSSI